MEYKTDPSLYDLLQWAKKISLQNFFFMLFLFGTSLVVIYSAVKLDISFFVTEVLLGFGLGLILCARISFRAKVVNNTVVQVNMLEQNITLTTAPFKFLFWVNKQPKEIKFELDTLRIIKTSYPIKPIYDLDNPVFKIPLKGDEFFIITDFFDQKLNEKLRELADAYN